MTNDFSPLPSYQQFCKGLETNIFYLAIINEILMQMNIVEEGGVYIIDSTALPICKTINSNCATLGLGLADYGKNIEGWFYGFKLHIIIDSNMNIVSFKFSTASTSDISALDQRIVRGLQGYLIGDRGYISQAKTEQLLRQNLRLLTRPRKNMKKLPLQPFLASLISIRSRVESVFGQLKDNFMLIWRKARSINSFFLIFLLLFVHIPSRKNLLFYP
jgi:hypothetical protein